MVWTTCKIPAAFVAFDPSLISHKRHKIHKNFLWVLCLFVADLSFCILSDMLSRRLVRIVAIFVAVTPSAFAAPMTLRVDATEAPRKIYHAELNIPATPGPMTLFYPKWIPGDHAPTGPINDLVGLRLSAAGQPLVWKRDSVELFAFHIDVPPDANSVDVRLDFLSPAENGTNSPVSATSELAILTWNQLVLYPRGQASDDLEITAQLRLPEGSKFGTALPVAKTNGSSVEFKPLTKIQSS